MITATVCPGYSIGVVATLSDRAATAHLRWWARALFWRVRRIALAWFPQIHRRATSSPRPHRGELKGSSTLLHRSARRLPKCSSARRCARHPAGRRGRARRAWLRLVRSRAQLDRLRAHPGQFFLCALPRRSGAGSHRASFFAFPRPRPTGGRCGHGQAFSATTLVGSPTGGRGQLVLPEGVLRFREGGAVAPPLEGPPDRRLHRHTPVRALLEPIRGDVVCSTGELISKPTCSSAKPTTSEALGQRALRALRPSRRRRFAFTCSPQRVRPGDIEERDVFLSAPMP